MDNRNAKLEAARAKLKKFQRKKVGNSTGSSSCKSQRSSSVCSSDVMPISNSSDKYFHKLTDNEMISPNGPNMSHPETPTMVQNEISPFIDPYLNNAQQYVENLSSAPFDATGAVVYADFEGQHFSAEVPQEETVIHFVHKDESPPLISHMNDSRIDDFSNQSWLSSETLTSNMIDVSHDSCRNNEIHWRQECARLEAELLDKQSNMEVLMQQRENLAKHCVFLEKELQIHLEHISQNPTSLTYFSRNTQTEDTCYISPIHVEPSQVVHRNEPCETCEVRQKQLQELFNKLTEIEQLSETKSRLIEVLQEDNRVLNRALAANANLRSQLEELQLKVNSQTATQSNHLSQETLENEETSIDEKMLTQRKEFESLQLELQDLQRRFMTLQDRCTVLEATNSRLEREVLQLDGETHTIGEYVLLYRDQRERLRNRASHLQYLTSELLRIKDCFLDKTHFLEQLMNEEGNSQLNDPESSPRKNMLSHILEIIKELEQLESNWPQWTESEFTSPKLAKFSSFNMDRVFHTSSLDLISHNSTHRGICDVPSCKCCTGQLVNL